MELPHIGQHCEICKRNDYLPFKCTHCDKIVCVDHKTDHGPECLLDKSHFEATAETLDSANTRGIKQACDYCRKITLKLELVECPHCKYHHCLYHRHQIQHDCRQLEKDQDAVKKEIEERSERQREALNRLKEITKPKTGTSNNPPKNAQSTDPKKQELARKVRLMRIKQFARGPPNILQEDKIYFEVKFIHEPQSPLSDPSKHNNSVKTFTTLKHTLGRMIDWSADELHLINKNHLHETSQLIFQKQTESEGLITLDSQKCFSFYLNNAQLLNGDEIRITYTKV